ncbi:GNAT family N-acetyltransferase [Kribbella sp. NPDC055071]
MEQLMVTRAAADDAERLTRLCHESSSYQGRYAEAIATVEVTPGYIADQLVFLAADEDARLLGFYSLIRDPPELDMLFVADEAQGRGAGRILVKHMIEQAQELGLAGVRVVSHPPAEGFYLRVGARRTGTVPANPPMITWERPELWFPLS